MAVEKHAFVTKWVGKARNPEILIPIDAARPGDLENRGFGQKIPKNNRKNKIFLFGVLCWGHSLVLWLVLYVLSCYAVPKITLCPGYVECSALKFCLLSFRCPGFGQGKYSTRAIGPQTAYRLYKIFDLVIPKFLKISEFIFDKS